MSKVNQDPTRPSRKYTRSIKRDPRILHGDGPEFRASISNSSLILYGAPSSESLCLHSIRTFSSKSSLSCSSDISAHSRPFRTFKVSSPASPKKRTRLLPRAYKRGGRNKPIVVRDSSSGEFQSPSLSSVIMKGHPGLTKEENRLTENQSHISGPAGTLHELFQVQTSILQSLGDRELKAEKRKKKKKRKQQVQQKMPVPLCSSQELSRLYSPQYKYGPASNRNSADVTLEQKAPPVNAATCKDGSPVDGTSEAIDATCADEKKCQPVEGEEGNAPKASLSWVASSIEEGSQDADQINTFGASALADSSGSSPAKLRTNQAAFSTTEALARQDDDNRNTQTTIPDQKLVDSEIAQEVLANIRDQAKTKRLLHRDKTPQMLSTDAFFSVHQQCSPTSSSYSQYTASTNKEYTDNLKGLAFRLGATSSNPILYSHPTGSSDTHSNTSLANPESIKSTPLADVKKFLVLNHADQQACSLDLEPYIPDPGTVERQLNHLRGDLADGEIQEAATLASSEGGSADIPRAWIDENRLEAQSPSLVGDEAEVSVFDPVGTMHKFLDIVTFPIKYIWSRIANDG